MYKIMIAEMPYECEVISASVSISSSAHNSAKGKVSKDQVGWVTTRTVTNLVMLG